MSKSLRALALTVAIVLGLVACGGGDGTAKGGSGALGAGASSAAGPASASGGSDRNAAAATDVTAEPGGAVAGASVPPGKAARPAGATGNATGNPSGATASRRATTSAAAASSVAPSPDGSGPSARPASSGAANAAPGSAAPPGGSLPGASGVGPVGPGDKTGVSATEIVLGMHMPQSGPTGVLLGNGWKGADAYFRSINDAGGVNGRRIKLVVADDKYSSQGAAGAIRELIDTRKVFAVGCPVGADQCSVGVAYANSKGVPYLSGGFREQYLNDKPWAFPVTAGYGYGAARLVDYLFQRRGYTPARKLGFFYLHSENFDELVQGADQELARVGAKFTVKYPAEKDQSDFSAAVTKMQSAGVDTMWFHTAPDLITKFAAQAKLLGYQPQYVFTAPAGGDIFATAAGGNLDKAFGLAAFDDAGWPGASKFRDMFHRYYPNDQVDEFNLLCYIVGFGFVEGVRRAGPDLGRDALARGLASIDHLDTGVSQPVSYTTRGRVAGPDSTFAVWEIHGTDTVQTTGFDF